MNPCDEPDQDPKCCVCVGNSFPEPENIRRPVWIRYARRRESGFRRRVILSIFGKRKALLSSAQSGHLPSGFFPESRRLLRPSPETSSSKSRRELRKRQINPPRRNQVTAREVVLQCSGLTSKSGCLQNKIGRRILTKHWGVVDSQEQQEVLIDFLETGAWPRPMGSRKRKDIANALIHLLHDPPTSPTQKETEAAKQRLEEIKKSVLEFFSLTE